jgi:two-component system, LytTR family, sensor kinase
VTGSSLPTPRWTLITGYVMMWVLLALVFASQSYAMGALKGEPMTWENALLWVAGDWAAWALVAPIPIWLARTYPLGRCSATRGTVLYVGGFLVTLVAHAGLYLAFDRALGTAWRPTDPFLTMWGLYIVKKAAFDTLVYAAIVGLMHGLSYYTLYRDREVQAVRLTAQLAETRLHVLATQLQPHFLFNTLNTVSALLRRDPDGADRVLSRLGDLLRLSLQREGVQCVTVSDELTFLEPFVEIQRTRFQDRLTVTIDATPDVLDAMVPSLLLQPLVENAIKHGLEPKAGAVTVRVTIRHEGEQLLLEICDDGRGVPADGPTREGIGLGNTRARLHELYGAAASLSITPAPGSGCCVRVLVPRKRR